MIVFLSIKTHTTSKILVILRLNEILLIHERLTNLI